ncbi:MAG: succinylglutamate desuccinylase/aspartoacylase family protein [Gemmatimonadaceae bacterium]|nr:succinylglutamate desuccinylase/aspartoacylase family protein [Gemmatimonadaceae bacterium]
MAIAGLLQTSCTGSDAALDPDFPLSIVVGDRPGPTVALVAGVHGGKVAAVHAAESLAVLLPGRIRTGRVLILAPANVAGFRAGLAQMSPLDSLNLNRIFPGDSAGTPTQRLAARIMRDIVAKSDYLVDIHGSDGEESVGSFAYAARPGLNPRVDSLARWMAERWEVESIVWDQGGPRLLAESRFLQTAAHLSDVPAITVFEPGATQESPVATARFVQGSLRLLAALGVVDSGLADWRGGRAGENRNMRQVLDARLVLSDSGAGRWQPRTRADAWVSPGDLLGTWRNAAGQESQLRASRAGVVLHLRHGGELPARTPLVILGLRQGDDLSP